MPQYICMDCWSINGQIDHNPEAFANLPEDSVFKLTGNLYRFPDPLPEDYVCPCLDPEAYVKRGYERNWGDAAVMNWPHLEILKKETTEGYEFVVLSPAHTRRPVILHVIKGKGGKLFGHGSY